MNNNLIYNFFQNILRNAAEFFQPDNPVLPENDTPATQGILIA